MNRLILIETSTSLCSTAIAEDGKVTIEMISDEPRAHASLTALFVSDMLKEKGVKSIKFLCVIAAPDGLKVVTEAHPDVPIYCGAIDDHLNEKAYIVPGLGDAGDRIYGTK